MEVPLKGASNAREILLLRDVAGMDSTSPLWFQFGVSHDGKAAAVASTYLAIYQEENMFKPEHCALFFIDLSDRQRRVTSVPIPLGRPRSGTRQ